MPNASDDGATIVALVLNLVAIVLPGVYVGQQYGFLAGLATSLVVYRFGRAR